MAKYTKIAEAIKETHTVRQLGSVWLWPRPRRFHVRDILEFADALREAGAPPETRVRFESGQELMSATWTTERHKDT